MRRLLAALAASPRPSCCRAAPLPPTPPRTTRHRRRPRPPPRPRSRPRTRARRPRWASATPCRCARRSPWWAVRRRSRAATAHGADLLRRPARPHDEVRLHPARGLAGRAAADEPRLHHPAPPAPRTYAARAEAEHGPSRLVQPEPEAGGGRGRLVPLRHRGRGVARHAAAAPAPDEGLGRSADVRHRGTRHPRVPAGDVRREALVACGGDRRHPGPQAAHPRRGGRADGPGLPRRRGGRHRRPGLHVVAGEPHARAVGRRPALRHLLGYAIERRPRSRCQAR